MTRSNAAAEHLAREYGDITDGSGNQQRQLRRRPKNHYKTGFSNEKALIYGVVQCLAGIAFVVLGVVSVSTGAWGFEYGCGLWCGALCLTAGIFGLASSRRKTNRTIITFMIVSAMAATAALITLSIASVGIVADHSLFDELDMSSYSSALVVHSLTIVVSIVAAFCGTMAAIVGCRGVCGAWYGADELTTDTENDIYNHPPGDYPLSGVFRDNLEPGLMTDHSEVASGPRLPGAPNVHLPLLGSGYQQIAIVPPVANGNNSHVENDDPRNRMIIMQSSGPGNQAVSQVMYILQAGAPCPQPGQPVAESADNSYSSPPPSYSTLALDLLSRSGEQQLDPDRTNGSNSDHDNSHDVSTYSYDISCPSNITNIILQDLCRLTNTPQQTVHSTRNANSGNFQNDSHTSAQNNERQELERGDDFYALREGETSFSSEWSNSPQPDVSLDTTHSSHQPDSINDQELPLLEASPQRYRPRQQPTYTSTSDSGNDETLTTRI